TGILSLHCPVVTSWRHYRKSTSVGIDLQSCIVVIVGALASTAFAAEGPASVVVRGAKGIIADTEFLNATALAIRGDKIVAVGSDQAIDEWTGPETARLLFTGITSKTDRFEALF